MKLPKLKRIYLASPRGFCAGVERSIQILNYILKKHQPPIYIRHQIVHNSHVIADFEKKGAIFVEDIAQIPDKKVVVFSAHGSPPSLYQSAKQKKLKVYDAVCPLVTKVHLKAKRYVKEGCFIFYIGHKGHPEAIGVISEIPQDAIVLIETLTDAKKVKPPQKEKLIALTQTTLSIDDAKEIINALFLRFPKMILPPAVNICYATQNRQLAAKYLSKKVDLVLVIGSKESSNANSLRRVCQKEGKAAYLINDKSEINEAWLKNVEKLGITAAASTPKTVVQEVIQYFKENNVSVSVAELSTVSEKVFFPLPKYEKNFDFRLYRFNWHADFGNCQTK